MIGYWNYTVILTFLSLTSSIMGMTAAVKSRFTVAVIFLALSGLLDAFDGKVARTKKDRSEDEKLYGVQLDSLCDVICFGAYPALLCCRMGLSGIIGSLVMIFYCIFAVARLAYFNVLETGRQQEEDGANKAFHGLPVTSISVIFPLVYLAGYFISGECKPIVLGGMLLVTGTLFVVDFKVKKPTTRELLLLILFVAAALLAAIYLYHWSRTTSLHWLIFW